jgi:hypothetical protein
MKTQKICLLFLMALSLLIVSCKKEATVPTYASNTIAPADQAAGAILDLGVIDADVHHMIVSLNDVSLTLSGEPLSISGAVESSKIDIDLFSNADGLIPDGTYTYSSDGNNAPFTFHSATIMMPDPNSDSLQSYSIKGGSIVLTRSGISYSIALDGLLDTGNNLKGTFSGNLNYADYVQGY